MNFTDKLWVEKWVNEYYPPIVQDYEKKGMVVGTDKEPDASLCLASFAEAMGSKFKEGMKVLDYGCGSARFANFLSLRLKDFQYFGLERKESNWGVLCVNKAIELFDGDSRVNVGYVNTKLEEKALETCDTVLLLSVFTHTTIEETEKILVKLLPIVNRGGNIVFSVIFADEYKLIGNAYGFVDNYNITYNTKKQIKDLKNKLNINICLIDTLVSDGITLSPNNGVIHSIYQITKI